MAEAYIVDAVRSPTGRRKGGLAQIHGADLGAHVLKAIVERNGIPDNEYDDVIFGCVDPVYEAGGDIARAAIFEAGYATEAPGMQINRFCASGMEAVYAAQMRMRAGAGEVFLVGGAESMSNYPLLMNDRMVRFFTRLSKARSLGQRLGTIASFRPGFLKPRIAILAVLNFVRRHHPAMHVVGYLVSRQLDPRERATGRRTPMQCVLAFTIELQGKDFTLSL